MHKSQVCQLGALIRSVPTLLLLRTLEPNASNNKREQKLNTWHMAM